MKTAPAHKVSWTRRFRDVVAGHIAALGEANVTPAKRAIIRSAATMELELEMMSRRFALRGNGATASDLILYAKISAAMQGLFNSVLGAEVSINHNIMNISAIDDDGRAAAAIERTLLKLIAERQERERENSLILDATANPPTAIAESNSEPTAEQERERTDINVVRLVPNAAAPANCQTSTTLFYESCNSAWWGPVGTDGGKLP